MYPLGMKSYNNYVNQGGYRTWKGSGINQNPIGIAPGHIRPLTNNDSGNIFPAPFGKARPLKHYRKGRVISVDKNNYFVNNDNNDNNNTNNLKNAEIDQVFYNLHRHVRSSLGTPLGEGRNGGGLLSEMMDKPGGFIVKENSTNKSSIISVPEENEINIDCKDCEGVGIVSSFYPNKFYLSENPEPNVENKRWCCNEERKARRRVVYASTNLKPNYYTTHFNYMQNRCQTFAQKSFNFEPPTAEQRASNTYLANCQPNAEIAIAKQTDLVYAFVYLLLKEKIISSEEYAQLMACKDLKEVYSLLTSETSKNAFRKFEENPYFFDGMVRRDSIGCKLTVYKPSNPEFAVEGAVKSSLKTLNLKVQTIECNSIRRQRTNDYILKNKVAKCSDAATFPFQNKKTCFYKLLPKYNTPVSQPSPYRYFISPIYSSNHFAQSPKLGLYLSSTRTK